jgi:hypothetical protein
VSMLVLPRLLMRTVCLLYRPQNYICARHRICALFSYQPHLVSIASDRCILSLIFHFMVATPVSPTLEGTVSPTSTYRTPEGASPVSLSPDAYLPIPGDVHMVHPIMFTPSLNASRTSSIFTSAPESASDNGFPHLDYAGYDSPPPANERLAELRNERRYRMLLVHEFHPSRT